MNCFQEPPGTIACTSRHFPTFPSGAETRSRKLEVFECGKRGAEKEKSRQGKSERNGVGNGKRRNS
jgi:hypothetical protein